MPHLRRIGRSQFNQNLGTSAWRARNGYVRNLRLEGLEERRLLAGFQPEWVREIGGDLDATQVNATAVDELGNAYIGGWTTATLPGQVFAGVQDGFVSKYDQSGIELWTREFGGESLDQVFGLALDESGLYVVGRADASLAGQPHLGGPDAFLQRYDAAGNLLWTRQLGSTSFDLANSVAVYDGAIYVAGETTGSLPGESRVGVKDAFVQQFDLDGNSHWTSQFGTGTITAARGVAATDSGIFVAGFTDGSFPNQSGGGNTDSFVRRLDDSGHEVWTRQVELSSHDVAIAVSADASGVYLGGLVDGAFEGESAFGAFDAYVRKYSLDGDRLWTRQFGTSEPDRVDNIVAAHGKLYLAGQTYGTLGESSMGLLDAFVSELSTDGDTLRTEQWGPIDGNSRTAVSASESRVYLAGTTEGSEGFVVQFNSAFISAPVRSGSEFRVNTEIDLDQRFWEPVPEATAMDADGDFVVTWSSQAQDGDGWGVFAQRFLADGTAAGPEFQVNSLAAGNQQYSTVAMAPDGDFVITWSTLANEVDNLGVFARRYNAAGVPQGEQFRVSSENPSFQRLSVAALDAEGNLLIAWSELDPAGGANAASNVRARLFNDEGVALGPAFQVNTTTANQQRQASVARNERGQFVIVWRSREQDGDSDGVFARIYAADGTPMTGELQINQAATGQQLRATVAMAPGGEFVVAWYSQLLGDNAGTVVPREVYARRFAADGAALGNEFRVNATTVGDQRYPSVAMDQHGNFVIAWSSSQHDTSDWGIYAQAFDASGTKVGGEFLVNSTVANRQIYPSVAMDDEGDFVVAWQSLVQDHSGYGIYAQRFTQPQGESFPTVTGVYVGGDDHAIGEGERLAQTPGRLVVAFSEAMRIADQADGVTNKANWSLTRNGVEINEQIASIAFAYNPATNRHEASLTLASPLADGDYRLTARASMSDAQGHGLDGDRNGEPGGEFSRTFSIAPPGLLGDEFQVNTSTASNQHFAAPAPGTVAMSPDGAFVVVWTSVGQDGSGQGVYGQRYGADGSRRGGEFPINTTTAGEQFQPAVAMAPGGAFVVAWTSDGQDGSGYGVYARRFAADGASLSGEFQVNTTTANAQLQPTVATDDGGNVVVAWESQGQDGSSSGIYFQRFAADGTRLGSETLANTFTADAQRAPQVARDADGDFVIVWQSRLQDGDGEGIFARRFTADGVPLGGELQVNSDPVGNQETPAVDMDADGDFAVVWRSSWQSRTGTFSTIFLQRFNAAGLIVGENQPVNSNPIHRDSDPSVALDDDGDLAVAWHYLRNPDPDAEDPDEWDVVTRRFAWNGDATTGEFRVNTYTQRNQQYASIAADADGDFVIAWESYLQDGSGTGIFAQRFQTVINTPPVANAGGPYTTVEGEVLQLRGVGSFDPDRGQTIRSFSWDVNDDGVFDDAVGIAPSLSWAELNALGIMDDGSREVRLRVTDSAGASTVATATFTIRDTAPSEVLHHPLAAVDEGGTQLITGSFEDPGLLDAHQAVVDWGDGTTETIDLPLGARTFALPHWYADDNPTGTQSDQYSVTFRIVGDGAISAPDFASFQVQNVAPIITDTVISASTVAEGSALTLTGRFSDPGLLDTHAVRVYWGDGATTLAAVDQVLRRFEASHTYSDEDPSGTPVDAYAITVTATDDDGGVGTAEIQLVVSACQVLGDTNGDCSVDLADLNNVRNHFGETGLGAVDLSFNAPVAETITDKDGLGVGFTHRLPGTGTALPANDPNLDLEPGVNGRLRIRSTSGSIGGASGGDNLSVAEAPGVRVDNVIGADLEVSATFLNVQVPHGSDQIFLYVGLNNEVHVRAGFHASNQYSLIRHTTGGADEGPPTPSNAFQPGDDIRITLSRTSGQWRLAWNNLTNPAASGSLESVQLAELDAASSLYIGIVHSSPVLANGQTAIVDSFTVDIRRSIAGDTNGDFVVDLADLNAVRNHFGAMPPNAMESDTAARHRRATDFVFGQLAEGEARRTSLAGTEHKLLTSRRGLRTSH